jgi:hypothetical protein
MNRRDCGDGPAPWQFYWDANREAMVRMVEVVPEGVGGRITDDRTGRSAVLQYGARAPRLAPVGAEGVGVCSGAQWGLQGRF